MNDEEPQLFGWGKPEQALSESGHSHLYHFFIGNAEAYLLESVCTEFYGIPWFYHPAEPLDTSRETHAEGNCLGCRAWLSIPANRREIEAEIAHF